MSRLPRKRAGVSGHGGFSGFLQKEYVVFWGGYIRGTRNFVFTHIRFQDFRSVLAFSLASQRLKSPESPTTLGFATECELRV